MRARGEGCLRACVRGERACERASERACARGERACERTCARGERASYVWRSPSGLCTMDLSKGSGRAATVGGVLGLESDSPLSSSPMALM